MSLTRRELLNRVALGAGAVVLGDLGTLLAARPASATTAASARSGHLPKGFAATDATRTAAEFFATLRPGSSVDLGGEVIVGNDVDTVPPGVTVQNGTFLGETHLFDANRLTFQHCTFIGDPTTERKTICKFLGGDGWLVDDCVFRGGDRGQPVGHRPQHPAARAASGGAPELDGRGTARSCPSTASGATIPRPTRSTA